MSEISKYEAQKKKLDGICEENHLVAIFRHDRYPITLTIKPLTGLEEQMSMLENVEEKGYISPDASIVFSVQDGVLGYKTSETFTISKPLFSKIENVFKRMHDFWLQFFFRDLMEKHILSPSTMPVIDGETEPEEDEQENALENPDIKTAASIVRANNAATTGLLQREMSIGYAKAQSLLEDLERFGVVGPFNGSQPREVLPWDTPEE